MLQRDFLNTRAVNRESSFYANAVSTTNGEVFTNAGATAGNYNAFKQLNALAGTLDDFAISFNGVACFKLQDVGTKVVLVPVLQ